MHFVLNILEPHPFINVAVIHSTYADLKRKITFKQVRQFEIIFGHSLNFKMKENWKEIELEKTDLSKYVGTYKVTTAFDVKGMFWIVDLDNGIELTTSGFGWNELRWRNDF